MSIILNDGIYSWAPKPADLKTVVGPLNPPRDVFEFSAKEDIPISYRYIGMTVLDVNQFPYVTWRLEGDTTDAHWIEQVNTRGSSGYVSYSTLAVEDDILFDIPDEFAQINTIVNVNGVTLVPTSYMIAMDTISNVNRIQLTFMIEKDDELNLTRLS